MKAQTQVLLQRFSSIAQRSTWRQEAFSGLPSFEGAKNAKHWVSIKGLDISNRPKTLGKWLSVAGFLGFHIGGFFPSHPEHNLDPNVARICTNGHPVSQVKTISTWHLEFASIQLPF